MSLKIFNSLSQQKEIFQPLETGVVKMYVCGPTVYDDPHIGHLRSAYVFEVMRRYLQSPMCGYKVFFVRNVTDVDDKIIEKARADGATDLVRAVSEISGIYFERYKRDLERLGISEPTREPKATEHIGHMTRLIEKLLEKGMAYESNGDVYYDVRRFGDYGKLSHQNQKSMLENVRIDKNEKKRDPLDFVLWKRAKEGEPSWPSPRAGISSVPR
jgi:cysteinyl-tRNA synthetase